MHLISFCLRPRLTAVLAVLSVSAATFAGALEDALRLVPADAAGALVIPSVKGASDDLQLAIDRMGKAEAALGGRPIDLLKRNLVSVRALMIEAHVLHGPRHVQPASPTLQRFR